MVYFGCLHRVVVNCMDVSEERTASVQRAIQLFRLDSEAVADCGLFLPSIAVIDRTTSNRPA